ncbi:Inner membrane metabolite transport protein YhjE [Pseudoclavibacter triregionum]|nr:Inner membrane metabolite transport protein YhjE [Pseudoclavibacter triregionum]
METFPASVRTSGVSISYAIGAILGGAFAPTIAAWLVDVFGSTLAVSMYLLLMSVVGLAATLILRDRQGIPLGVEFEESGEYRAFDPARRDDAATHEALEPSSIK